MTDPTPAQLAAFQLQAETGMTAADLVNLPMDQYARLTNRLTPTQAALAAIDAQTAEPPGTPRQEPTQAPAPEVGSSGPQGLDPNSPEYFHAWRAQRKRGGEGKGIFDSVGSRSDEYTAAVRAQAGRTGWDNSNVQEAPRIERAYVQEEQPPVYRSAAERFSTPGNYFGG